MYFSDEDYSDESLFEINDEKEASGIQNVPNNWVYEALGAPTLLYRHTGGTLSDGVMKESSSCKVFTEESCRKDIDTQNAAIFGGSSSLNSPTPEPWNTHLTERSEANRFATAWHRSNMKKVKTISKLFPENNGFNRLDHDQKYSLRDDPYIQTSLFDHNNAGLTDSILSYQRDKSHTSSRDGYIAPFSRSCIAYSLRENMMKKKPTLCDDYGDKTDDNNRSDDESYRDHDQASKKRKSSKTMTDDTDDENDSEKIDFQAGNRFQKKKLILEKSKQRHDTSNKLLFGKSNTSLDGIAGTCASEYDNCLLLIPCQCYNCIYYSSNKYHQSDNDMPSYKNDISVDSDDLNQSADGDTVQSIESKVSKSSNTGVSISMSNSVNDEIQNDYESKSSLLNDDSKNSKSINSPCWVAIHPAGDCLCVSRIQFPHGPNGANNAPFQKNNSQYYPSIGKKKIDIGGEILQVEICSDIENLLNIHHSKQSTADIEECTIRNHPLFIIVRSKTFCSILKCEIYDKCVSEGIRKESDDSCQRKCVGEYRLSELERIDLRFNAVESSYLPTFIATNPTNPVPYVSNASFAIVSRTTSLQPSQMGFTIEGIGRRKKEENNIIHHALVKEKGARIIKHTISNLEYISKAKFSRMNPLVLWSAARSKSPPPQFIKHRHSTYDGPLLGYGHSLYSIDLRSDQGSLIWSPSHAVKTTERLHSISALYPDNERENIVVLSSESAAGKIWQIDVRMPLRPVCTWSLPGICDDWSLRANPDGIYGCGTIFTSPYAASLYGRDTNIRNDFYGSTSGIRKAWYPPLLSINKRCSFGLSVLHEPLTFPRFHTENLECIGNSHMNVVDKNGMPTSSYAQSTVFKYPDVSSGVLITGLGAFFTKTSSILNDISALTYQSSPVRSMCVISCTNKGDLYGHTILECDANGETKAEAFDGLPVGSNIVPVPSTSQSRASMTQDICEGELTWYLSNSFAVPNKSIIPHHVSSRTQCHPFSIIKKKNLPTYTPNIEANPKTRKKNIKTVSFSIAYDSFPHKCSNKKLKKRPCLQVPQNDATERGALSSHESDDSKDGEIYDANEKTIDISSCLIKKLEENWESACG